METPNFTLRISRTFKSICKLLLASLTLSLYGCDGGISIQGRVYKITNPNASSKSSVYESDPTTTNKNLTPLQNAQVLLFRSPLAEQGKTDAWKSGVSTDENGYFDTGGACAPGREQFSVQVGKDKYQSVIYKFKTTNGQRTMYIVLVPTPNKK